MVTAPEAPKQFYSGNGKSKNHRQITVNPTIKQIEWLEKNKKHFTSRAEAVRTCIALTMMFTQNPLLTLNRIKELVSEEAGQ